MQLLQNTNARPVAGVSFDGSRAKLLAGGSGGFDLWDLRNTSHRFIRSHAVRYLFACRCDPLGRWAYVSDYLRGFRLLSITDQVAPVPPGSPYQRHVTSIDVTPDGKHLVMNRGGSSSNRVECWNINSEHAFMALWSIRDGEPVDPNEPYYIGQAKWFTNGVAFSHDGLIVVTAESRGMAGSSHDKPVIVLREGASGRAIAELGESGTSFETRLAMDPDGQALYVWDNRVLERWDLIARRRTSELPAPARGYFRGLVVHPSRQAVVTVSGDGQARYWDPLDLSLIRAIKCGAGKLHSLALSADGESVAAGADKGRVVLWDFAI